MSNTLSETPDMEITDFRAIGTTSGHKEWVMYAKKAKNFDKRRETIGERITVNFYRKNNDSSILTADRGRINMDTNDMEVEGHIKIFSHENEKTLETSHLQWLESQQKIISNEWVKLIESDSITTGYGFETDPHLDRVVIREKVRIRMRL